MAFLFFTLGFILTFLNLSVLKGGSSKAEVNQNLCISLSWPLYVVGLLWVHKEEIGKVLGLYFVPSKVELVTDDWPYSYDDEHDPSTNREYS